MDNYKDKLNSFGSKLKGGNQHTPLQEVRPIKEYKNIEKNIVRTTVHLPEVLHTKAKLYCIQHKTSLKDYVTSLINKDINTNTKTQL